MNNWETKLGCGHARVRIFQPAFGGVDYTCKDLAEFGREGSLRIRKILRDDNSAYAL